eukprot:gnl/MRDRNA2_/MRDRNA2_113920_c0_seq1.p2 gnl/MRDRNA2_/MRDRNA2_113920_c0~~gnl/MRDRNA2_/MRDRNA2_113920_c0_seq1.p2  ORF type:complete len:125 (+),score=16.14 gnl/MRDRNA2_/MRDRNA2_113920_c0_seq1:81-455(+)
MWFNTLILVALRAQSLSAANVRGPGQQAVVSDLPVCADITCADIECLAPLEIRRLDDQCCPICWAPDHVISLDRHSAMKGSPYAEAPHPAAPTTCGGVKCFKVICPTGYKPGHVSGDCCTSCVS